MKLIKPSVEFWGEVPTDYEGTLKWIERAGRVCYKSEDKICEGSAEKFVRKLVKAGHWAMLEHSNFVIRSIEKTPPWEDNYGEIITECGKFLAPWFDDYNCVGGNLTAWFQKCAINNGYSRISSMFYPFYAEYKTLFPFEYQVTKSRGEKLEWKKCPPDEIPKSLRRYTVKFICDRGVSHEIVRHRPCSFAQESTRYVDYGGKDIEFIEPSGWGDWDKVTQMAFKNVLELLDADYTLFRKRGLSPQQARAVLPNALKTELVVTADAAEWAHIKKLRTAPDAHPDMRHIMSMVPWEEIL